jgi:TonB family protein
MQELLASAYEAARHSKPDVRVAALLRIARVQTVLDRGQARRTLELALDEIRRIPGRDGALLLDHARTFAAVIAPDLLAAIPSERLMPRHFEAESMGKVMIEHGNTEAALAFVMNDDDASTFPYSVAGMLMERVGEQERLALLRCAAEAWRETHNGMFVWLLQYRWKLLPEEEAREIVREVVGLALDRPDKPIQATYDREGTVQITSDREHTLFQILHILRHLDEPLADSLLAAHAQLAAAARRFPYGIETIQREAEERRKSEGESCGGGFVMGGNPRDFPYMRALMRGRQDGDFEEAMEHAQEQYRDDAGPENRNQAPLEFWPSANRFRSILYAAGKRLCTDAGRYLARIDDADLRLFAQIELAAALGGLPELNGIERQHAQPPGQRTPDSGSVGAVGSGKGGGLAQRWSSEVSRAIGPGEGRGFGGGVFRVGGGVTAPTLLYKEEPEYSEEARKAKFQGTVVLYVEVDPSGKAINPRVIRSLGLGLDEKAIEAVRKWKFKPGYKDGKPVTVAVTIQVNFRLL